MGILDAFEAQPNKPRSTILTAKVSKIVADKVFAVAPSFSPSHEFGPLVAEHAADMTIGDSVLVAFDEQGSPWLVSWAGTAVGTIVPDSLPPSGPAGGDLAGTYPNPTIGSAKVTNAKMAANAVSTGVIVDAAVTNAKMAANAVSTGVIVDAAVTSSKIASSIALAGAPTAATASVGTNTTQIATTAYVYSNPRIAALDTRAVEETPEQNANYQQSFHLDFKTRTTLAGAPGTGTYGLLSTYAPWTDDSGGAAKQLWMDDSNPPRMFIRRGTIAAGWSTWSEFATLASPAFTGTPTSTTAAVDTNTTQIATTAYVIGQGYLKASTASSTYAPLASPTFTGTPAAPTAAGGTNTTQIATTAFVQGELAAKAPLASPTFTGNPTGPTPAANDNDTSLATTAFVAANALSLLATGTKRKVAFGSSSTTWPGGSNSSNLMTIAHGLGVAPSLVLIWSLDPPTIASYAVRSAAEDGTNLYIKNITSWLQPAGGTGAGVAWLAIA